MTPSALRSSIPPCLLGLDPDLLVIDLFCGAGGTTTGYAKTKKGKVIVVACINHDKKAIRSHWRNHRHVKHFEEDIRTLDLSELVNLVNEYRRFYPRAKVILWASLECTNFSKAKGGLPRDADSRTLAESLFSKWNPLKREYFDAPSYIQLLNPDYIKIENVVEFMAWGPMKIKAKKYHKDHTELAIVWNKKLKCDDYAWEPVSKKNGRDWLRWRENICNLGYHDEWKEMNAADFGATTSRNRLFGMFARRGMPIVWPAATHAKNPKKSGTMFGPQLKKWKPVRPMLDLEDKGQSILLRKKPLSPKTMQRVYAGLVKFVAGGKDNFMAKTYAVASNSDGVYSTESPAHTITTRDAQQIVQPEFISQYNSGKDDSRNTSTEVPLRTITCDNRFAVVQAEFICKHYSGSPDDKNISTHGPAGSITTRDSQALVQAEFFLKYYSGNPETKNSSVDDPAPTIRTKDGIALVQSEFLTLHYSNGGELSSTENPCPALTTKDRVSIVQPQFIMRDFSSGGESSSIESPAGALMPKPKINLVSVENPQFIMRDFQTDSNKGLDEPAGTILPVPKQHLVSPESFLINQNYSNGPSSLDEPAQTITANRKYHYIINPQWANGAADIDKPCFTLIARMDKAPPYLVVTESGSLAIRVYDTDCEYTVKIKEFMAMYGIGDIKMRMLKIPELLKIQGFPKSYKLYGNTGDQKKFIGNSVVPKVVTAWADSLITALREPTQLSLAV